jgi:hypothetical protein
VAIKVQAEDPSFVKLVEKKTYFDGEYREREVESSSQEP